MEGSLSCVWKDKWVLGEESVLLPTKKRNAGVNEGEMAGGEGSGRREWMRNSMKYSEKGVMRCMSRWITGVMGGTRCVFPRPRQSSEENSFIGCQNRKGHLRGKE